MKSYIAGPPPNSALPKFAISIDLAPPNQDVTIYFTDAAAALTALVDIVANGLMLDTSKVEGHKYETIVYPPQAILRGAYFETVEGSITGPDGKRR